MNIFCDIEVIFIGVVVDKTDTGACQGGFANAVRNDRRFLPEVRPDHQNRVAGFKLRNTASQPREDGIIVLVGEVPLPNSVIYICSADMIGEPREQVTFFKCRPC